MSMGILAANLILIGVVWYLRSRAMKNPQAFWAFLLFGAQVGPRTDVPGMTKAELTASGLRFVTWGLIFSSLMILTAIIANGMYEKTQPHGAVVAVLMLTGLFSGMGYLGGFYLLIRALFRSKNYVPG
jgi:hypothetical protein